MAQKTVAKLKESVSGQLQGLNLNNVSNLFTAFERAARNLSQRINIPDTEGRHSITLYDGVTDYPANSDVFGNQIVDLQPQGDSRILTNFIYRRGESDFDRLKDWLPNGAMLTAFYKNGTPLWRIVSTSPTPRIELDPMTDDSGWTAGGSASGLAEDATVFWQRPASLRFTLTGASTGTLTKTITQVDLTDYAGVGVVFLAFRTPSAANLTSFSIKLGSTSGLATNYYQVSSVTTGFIGAWTANEWLIVALNLANATTVGTPVNTALKYVELDIAHAATLTNFYVGDLWISLPSPHTLIYPSSAFFLASGGSPLQTITNANDTVILNDAAYAIYEIECALSVAEQQGGTLASGVVATLRQRLNGIRSIRNGALIEMGLYDLYRAENPSQKTPQIANYYDD